MEGIFYRCHMKFRIPTSTPMPIGQLNAAKSSFDLLVNAWSEYKKTSEEETTKRVQINAWKEANLAKISAQRSILEQYLTATFNERSDTISALFERLDKGIESGNPDLINATLGGIIEIAKISPLRDALKLVDAVNDSNIKNIEI